MISLQNIHVVRSEKTISVKNNKGGLKLCHEGFMYTKKNAKKTTIRWECSQRCAFSCKGSITTDLEMQTIMSCSEHCHAANESKVLATKVYATIKENASSARGSTQQILADATANASVQVTFIR